MEPRISLVVIDSGRHSRPIPIRSRGMWKYPIHPVSARDWLWSIQFLCTLKRERQGGADERERGGIPSYRPVLSRKDKVDGIVGPVDGYGCVFSSLSLSITFFSTGLSGFRIMFALCRQGRTSRFGDDYMKVHVVRTTTWN